MTTSDCSEIRPLLAALVSGDLDSGETATAQAHLDGCALCRDDLKGLRRTSESLRRALGGPLPEAAFSTPVRLPGPQSRGRWLAAAAAAVIVSLAGLSAANARVTRGTDGWAVQFSLRPPAGEPDPAVIERLVTTRVDERVNRALALQEAELDAVVQKKVEQERQRLVADLARTLAQQEKILTAGLSQDRRERIERERARDAAFETLVGSEMQRTQQMLGAVLAASTQPTVVEQ